MNQERRNFGRRLIDLAWRSDTTPTKFSLWLGGAIMAASFWIDRDHCVLRACRYIEQAMPWQWWGIAWTVYAVVKFWRIFDGKPRPKIALLINALGLFLFAGTAIGTTVARWPSLAVSAYSIVLALAAAWVFLRTAINPGRGFRAD